MNWMRLLARAISHALMILAGQTTLTTLWRRRFRPTPKIPLHYNCVHPKSAHQPQNLLLTPGKNLAQKKYFLVELRGSAYGQFRFASPNRRSCKAWPRSHLRQLMTSIQQDEAREIQLTQQFEQRFNRSSLVDFDAIPHSQWLNLLEESLSTGKIPDRLERNLGYQGDLVKIDNDGKVVGL